MTYNGEYLSLPELRILIAAAVLPSLIYMIYIYMHDTREKEPVLLIVKLVLFGVLSALIACLGELGFEYLVFEDLTGSSFSLAVIMAVAVGLIEEGAKLFMLKTGSWRNPAFNYRFDAIVYSASVSLGFAGFENISYIFQYGLQVSLSRALLAVPAHLAFSVFMGVYYGRAKAADYAGKSSARSADLVKAYLLPATLHAIYDGLLMTGTSDTSLLFLVFVIVVDVAVYRRVKRESATDGPIV